MRGESVLMFAGRTYFQQDRLGKKVFDPHFVHKRGMYILSTWGSFLSHSAPLSLRYLYAQSSTSSLIAFLHVETARMLRLVRIRLIANGDHALNSILFTYPSLSRVKQKRLLLLLMLKVPNEGQKFLAQVQRLHLPLLLSNMLVAQWPYEFRC